MSLNDYFDHISPSGREEDFRDFLISRITADVKITRLADYSLLVSAGSAGDREAGGDAPVLFAAAMDEPPFYITHRDESGFLSFAEPAGAYQPGMLPGRAVKFLNGKNGLICLKQGVKLDAEIKTKDMYIDVGETPDSCRPDSCRPDFIGTPAVLAGELQSIGGLTAGSAAGMRAVCAGLIGLINARIEPERGFHAVFCAKTLIKQQSAAALELSGRVGAVIGITASPAGDVPGTGHNPVNISSVVLRMKDKSMMSDLETAALLDKAAERAGVIPVREVSDLKNPAAPFVPAGLGTRAACLALPVRGIGTGCEMYDPGAAADLFKVVYQLTTNNSQRTTIVELLT